jgi:hypothetical protein
MDLERCVRVLALHAKERFGVQPQTLTVTPGVPSGLAVLSHADPRVICISRDGGMLLGGPVVSQFGGLRLRWAH